MRASHASLLVLVPCLALALGFASSATAAAPNDISFQGRLTDADGDPLEGDVNLVVGIWTAPISGDEVFSEAHLNVSLDNGVFNVLIGQGALLSGDPLGPETFDGADRFLQVAVDGESLSPRVPISSGAYALQAAEDSIGGDEIKGSEVPIYAVTNPNCEAGSELSLSPTCATKLCSFLSFFTCGGACVAPGPEACDNLLMGYLLDPTTGP
jgi:hypothetical protein